MSTYVGTPGDDTIRGGRGIDVLIGLAGDDSYFVDDPDDQVIEAEDEGYDIVYAAVDYVLTAGSYVEVLATNNLATTPIRLIGNERDNYIIGNAGMNVLDGREGADVLWGREGDDSYFVDSDDIVYELPGQGSDIVYARSNFTLGPGSSIERFGTANNFGTEPIELRGNELNQVIVGNNGDNLLVGGGGLDFLDGRGGNDVYYSSGKFSVYERPNDGFDTVYTYTDFTSQGSIEVLAAAEPLSTTSLFLIGDGTTGYIGGNAGANVIYGRYNPLFSPDGPSVGVLAGGAGNDFYYLFTSSEVIVEKAGEGFDTVAAFQSYQLNFGASVERLASATREGTSAQELIGNEIAQSIEGSYGANWLDGKGGSDTLDGVRGADTYAFTTMLGFDNVDTILSFQSGEDRIALDDAVFAGLAPGTLSPDAFRIGTEAQDADDRLIYNPATGKLLFDADGAGGADAVEFALLTGAPPIASSDFLVI